MARKDASQSSSRGLNDVAGIALATAALLLMVALLSYDHGDSAVNIVPANNQPHNLGGPLGAWVALRLFWVFGIGAFMIPVLLLMYGLGYIFQFLAYLQRRWLWGAVLLLCCMGLASTFETDFRFLQHLQRGLNAPSVGGLIGQFLEQHVLHYVGKVGATIVLGAVYLISLIYLTNFKLGEWCRNLLAGRPGGGEASSSARENDLERRARDLEKQARKLQEQVEKSTKTGGAKVLEPGALGADMRPVPEPTVRDLSVPQGKPGEHPKKQAAAPPKEPIPPEEGVVIPAREVAAATTADILGQPPEAKADTSAPPVKMEEAGATAKAGPGEPEPSEALAAAAPAPKPRPAPRKPKSIAAAAPPKIGNYILPPLDFLQFPDTTTKPTESKEELMANARLIQQTLAQFDIEVSLGDITKGPTITRYELHPAPQFGGRGGPQRHQDQSHHARRLRVGRMAQHQGPHSAGFGQGRLWPADCGRPLRDAAPAHRRQHRLRQIGLHQRHHHLPALQVSAGPIALRHDRPQSRRASAIQPPAPSGGAGGDGPQEGHPGSALGGE